MEFNVETSKMIYNSLADQISRDIYSQRLISYLTGDLQLVQKLYCMPFDEDK